MLLKLSCMLLHVVDPSHVPVVCGVRGAIIAVDVLVVDVIVVALFVVSNVFLAKSLS